MNDFYGYDYGYADYPGFPGLFTRYEPNIFHPHPKCGCGCNNRFGPPRFPFERDRNHHDSFNRNSQRTHNRSYVRFFEQNIEHDSRDDHKSCRHDSDRYNNYVPIIPLESSYEAPFYDDFYGDDCD